MFLVSGDAEPEGWIFEKVEAEHLERILDARFVINEFYMSGDLILHP